jgi:hypothetical protein
MKCLTCFLKISLATAVFAGVASADVNFLWTFGDTSTPTVPYGSGSFSATLVNGLTYPGLYQIDGGTGTITDSSGTYNVSVAGLLDNYGGDQGLCTGSGTGGSVVDPNAVCNTMRGVDGTGANYTFDNLLYTGASQGTGQPFDANGIGFVSGGGEDFVLTTTNYSGNGGGALYCGPGSVYCESPANTLSVTLQSSTPQPIFSSTPEPGYYGVLALGLGSLVTVVSRRKRV